MIGSQSPSPTKKIPAKARAINRVESSHRFRLPMRRETASQSGMESVHGIMEQTKYKAVYPGVCRTYSEMYGKSVASEANPSSWMKKTKSSRRACGFLQTSAKAA